MKVRCACTGSSAVRATRQTRVKHEIGVTCRRYLTSTCAPVPSASSSGMCGATCRRRSRTRHIRSPLRSVPGRREDSPGSRVNSANLRILKGRSGNVRSRRSPMYVELPESWMSSEVSPRRHRTWSPSRCQRGCSRRSREGRAVGNADLAVLLGTDDWQVSRAGRRLRELGLVTRARLGRVNVWDLTDAGRQVVERLRRDGEPKPRSRRGR